MNLGDLPPYSADDALQVVVETPRGSTAKFKYDEQHGVVRLSRPLPAGISYPYDWGFVPGTRAADGDPLDVMVLWESASYPGVVITVRPVGVLRVEQANPKTRARERNDRLLAIPTTAHTRIPALDDRLRSELEHFFLAAVAFEGKDVKLLGWGDAAEAASLANEAVASAGAGAEHQESGG